MKRLTNRKFRLGFYLKLFLNSGEVVCYNKRVKNKIFDLLQGSSFTKGYLKVTYKPDVVNEVEGTCQELLNALNVFTEKGTLDYAEKF